MTDLNLTEKSVFIQFSLLFSHLLPIVTNFFVILYETLDPSTNRMLVDADIYIEFQFSVSPVLSPYVIILERKWFLFIQSNFKF